MKRKDIRRNILRLGMYTAVSRVLGITRASLQMSYLGLGELSDAFLMAYRIPNFLRKIFAEGALSASFVPLMVSLLRQKNQKEAASRLVVLTFIIVQSVLALLTALVVAFPQSIMAGIAPGFSDVQRATAGAFIQILFPFIFFITGSAVLEGPLHAMGTFLVSAGGPIILNCAYLGGILLCRFYQYPPTVLAGIIVGGGAVHFLWHIIIYKGYGFSFFWPRYETLCLLGTVVKRFGVALLGLSVLELNVMIDSVFASYLPSGSVSVLHYANRFMGIPLGMFGVAFSSVLLPFFSLLKEEHRARFSFYFYHAVLFIFNLMIPALLILLWIAPDIFVSFLGNHKKFETLMLASKCLQAYGLGLLFFSVSKVMMSIFYALHDMKYPFLITLIATVCNTLGNSIAVSYQSVIGIALSTAFSVGVILSMLLYYFLMTHHKIEISTARLKKLFFTLVSQFAIAFFSIALCSYLWWCILHFFSLPKLAVYASFSRWRYIVLTSATGIFLFYKVCRTLKMTNYFFDT